MLALLDGNNFYVSCERVFRPSLQGRPVIVLSNNDGCAISRSDEAKALGVKMGQPFHEFRQLEDRAGLISLSANFTLYGDMSDRMMTLAAGLGPGRNGDVCANTSTRAAKLPCRRSFSAARDENSLTA